MNSKELELRLLFFFSICDTITRNQQYMFQCTELHTNAIILYIADVRYLKKGMSEFVSYNNDTMKKAKEPGGVR